MHLTRQTMDFRRVCFVFWWEGEKQFLDLLSNKTRLLTEDKTYFCLVKYSERSCQRRKT